VAEPREQSESVAADLRAGNDTVQSLAARKNYWQAPEDSLRPPAARSGAAGAGHGARPGPGPG
jgi:hypothetical protein